MQQPPPLSAEEFIFMVQQERNKLPEWTTNPSSRRLNSESKRLEVERDGGTVACDSAVAHTSFDRNMLPNYLMPSAGWIEENLKRAEMVRRGLSNSKSLRCSLSAVSLPTIQSKKHHFLGLFRDHQTHATALVPAMSQPIVLRFLKHFIEWVANAVPPYNTIIRTGDVQNSANHRDLDSEELDESLTDEHHDHQEDESLQNTLQMQTESIDILNCLQWIYFLLCKCDSLLEADDVYMIRTLCKTLITKRLEFWIAHVESASVPSHQGQDHPIKEEEEELEEGEEREEAHHQANPAFVYFTLCIMIITRGWYGQKDLQDEERRF